MNEESTNAGVDKWITIGEKFGLPTVLLLGLTVVAGLGLRWFGTEYLTPQLETQKKIVAQYIETVSRQSEVLNKVGTAIDEITIIVAKHTEDQSVIAKQLLEMNNKISQQVILQESTSQTLQAIRKQLEQTEAREEKAGGG